MSKQKDKERAKRQRQRQSEHEKLKYFASIAPHMKRLLRSWGCDLPFYDLLDSYAEKFQQIAKEALERHPSLRGVHEVDETTYKLKDWSRIGYGHLRESLVHFDDQYENDYGSPVQGANLCGLASIFYDEEGRRFTGIMVRQCVKGGRLQHPEFKYVNKTAALLHEIGHVEDIESGINFHVEGDKVKTDIIEAEVYANLYALDKLAEAHLRLAYELVLTAMRQNRTKAGYKGEVSQKVLERHIERQLADWQDVRQGHPFTEADLAVLGEAGYRAIQAKMPGRR